MSNLNTQTNSAGDSSVELLRVSTCGSVDDGKSTLIGRLLHDTKNVSDDQLLHVEDVSRRRGDQQVNLALLTDGLRAEREQGITIDVAHRYFATSRRRFIVADTPGHAQYTRNMVTGASTSELAIVLVDARKGLVEQSRRHAALAALLGIPQLVFAVNKMDLVEWREDVFRNLEHDLAQFASQLGVKGALVIPLSALSGDNVVERGSHSSWYSGPSLLEHLETVSLAQGFDNSGLRLPVQWVVRPQVSSGDLHDFRGYAGQLAGGILRPGDRVTVLPSGLTTRVSRVETFDGPMESAFAPLSVTVHLEHNIDVSRGDMLCHPHDKPQQGQLLDAMLSWMSQKPLLPGARLALKHTTRWVRATVSKLDYCLDVNTLQQTAGIGELVANDIGRVKIHTTLPLFYDAYSANRNTGSFILVDEATNDTVAAGMLLPPVLS